MAAPPVADGSSSLVQKQQGRKLQLVDKVGFNYLSSGYSCSLAVYKSARPANTSAHICPDAASSQSSHLHIHLHFPDCNETVKI